MHSCLHGFFYFTKSNSIGGIKNLLWFKPCMQCQLYFIDRTAINLTAHIFYIPKDIYIRKCLTGIKEFCIQYRKSSGKLFILLLYFFCMIDI
jgi:hypothetical protein